MELSAGRGYHRGGQRFNPEMTTLEVIAMRREHGVNPLMIWDDNFKVWIPCQRMEDESIDKMAGKVMFGDGLVWIPNEQVFVVLSGPYMSTLPLPETGV